MRIIIAGCGNVGKILARQFSLDGHEVVIIDTNGQRLSALADEIDAICLMGDATSMEILAAADVDSADLFIAVTGSDEKNLLSCLMASRRGNCKTIARVADPVYFAETSELKHTFGIDVIINPAQATAVKINKLVSFPAVTGIDSFSRTGVDLFHFKIAENSKLAGRAVKDIRSAFKKPLLFCLRQTPGGDVLIPNGDTVFSAGDTVTVCATSFVADTFFRSYNIPTGKLSEVIIAGGGNTAFYLTKELLHSNINITIVESDPERAEYLSDTYPKATVVIGDATDEKLLDEENIGSVRGFISTMGIDEENILLSLYVRSVNPSCTVMTRIHRTNFESVIRGLDLGTVLRPQQITSDIIKRYVNSLDAARDYEVETMYTLENGRTLALELVIREETFFTGVPLTDLVMKGQGIVCSINRDRRPLIPGGSDCIQVGDSVIVMTDNIYAQSFDDIFERKAYK